MSELLRHYTGGLETMTKKESRQDVEQKLIQVQEWLFENRAVFTEHELSVIFAFTKKMSTNSSEMSAFSGGKAQEIGVACTGMICELIDSIDDERALRKLFNLTAGKICEKFEEKMREEGYVDDDED
jgi:hypothetical protein